MASGGAVNGDRFAADSTMVTTLGVVYPTMPGRTMFVC